MGVMVTIIIERTMSWFVGVSAGVGVFLIMIRCSSVGVTARGAHFAGFDMVRDYLLFEGSGALGAVGVYEQIAGVVFWLLGQRGNNC